MVYNFLSSASRQSIDIYSSIHSPNLSFLGTPTLSRLSNSFLTNSFRGGKPPEIISNLIKPLLPTSTATSEEQQQPEDVRKSSQYLPPSRKASSLQRIPEDHKPLGGGHGHEVGPYRQCSYTQGVMNGTYRVTFVCFN